jgi:hypothetical protein
MKSASRGTATSASQNPNADRITVARAITAITESVWSAGIVPPPLENRMLLRIP